MIKVRQAGLVVTAIAALASTGAAHADGFDGNYSTSFSYQMGNGTGCPSPLEITISVSVKNSGVSGTIRNDGGGNSEQHCALFHNGSISGAVDASGNLNSVTISQRDGRSAQYSSYALTGNLSGSVSLLSRRPRFFPTVSFKLSRSGGASPSTDQPSIVVGSDTPAAGYEQGRNAFVQLNGAERIAVQETLKYLDLYSGTIDGKWGNGTHAAVKAYLYGKDETQIIFQLAVSDMKKGTASAAVSVDIKASEVAESDQTLGSAPATLEYAQALISDVEAFVASGQADFDIAFAKKYSDIGQIKDGSFSTEVVDRFKDFEAYVSSSDAFRKYRASRELERVSTLRAEVADLKSQITSGEQELTAWIEKNLLDPQSASVVEVVEAARNAVASEDVVILRSVASKIELAKAKTGILNQETLTISPAAPANPDQYTSDAIYLLGNFSGNGEHIYKGLSGLPEFDNGTATACLLGSLDQWEKFSVSSSLSENFGAPSLTIKTSDCRGAEDLVIAKGVELNSNSIASSFNPSALEEILVIEQKAVFEQKAKLQIASELYEADIMNGSKVGHGLVIFNESTAALCLIVEGNKDDHLVAIEANKKVLSTFVEFTGGYALAEDAIDAFKRIQRSECGAIYADAATLYKLIEASKNNGLEYLVAPAWVTPNSLQEISLQREANDKAVEAQQEAFEQNAALREQANATAQEKALVQQAELRERHNVRFSALLDDLSGKLRVAVDFAFVNSPLDKGYEEKYRSLPILDPVDQAKSAFDPIIDEIQSLSLEKWEMTGFILEKIDYGDVSYNGRTLEGVIVELKISVKNRVVGDFQTYCRVVRAVQDDDFDMLRQISIQDCGADDAGWKLQNAFESKWIVDAQ